jgi:regulatory protein
MARRRPSRSTASDPPADAPAAAFAVAVAYLARAPRSVAEVAAHLEARSIDAPLVAATLAILAERRYVDDDALAERRAEELILRRGYGRLKVASELTRRGLTDTVVDRAIAGVLEGRSEAALGRAALRRRFGDRVPASRAERAKAFRFLAGRGHPTEIVSEILGEDD